MTVAVTSNVITQYNNDGLLLQACAGLMSSGNFDSTVTGNIIGPLGTNTAAAQGVGIRLTSGVTPGSPGDSFQTCLQLGGPTAALKNVLTTSGISGTDSDYRVRQRFDTTVRLLGYSGGTTDTAAVVAFIDANNTTTAPAPGGTATVQSPPDGGGFVGGAACALPSP